MNNWTGGVTQAVECLLYKCRSPKFKPQSPKWGEKKSKNKLQDAQRLENMKIWETSNENEMKWEKKRISGKND
jgi:hypothetical protein